MKYQVPYKTMNPRCCWVNLLWPFDMSWEWGRYVTPWAGNGDVMSPHELGVGTLCHPMSWEWGRYVTPWAGNGDVMSPHELGMGTLCHTHHAVDLQRSCVAHMIKCYSISQHTLLTTLDNTPWYSDSMTTHPDTLTAWQHTAILWHSVSHYLII